MSMSPLLVLPLIEAVERVGVSRTQLLDVAGLDPKRLDECNARLSVIEYDRVQLAALELSGDEALGLHLGQRARTAAYPPIGHLIDHAPTLRQAIEVAMRYQAILSDSPEPRLYEDSEVATIRYDFPPIDSPGIRMDSELAMSGYLRLIRMFAGHNAWPRGVFFAYQAPDYRDEYTRIFGGVERFGHAFTGIVFERAWLENTQLFYHPEIYSILKGQAERALGRLMRNGNQAEFVQDYLASCDPRQMPSMEQVAMHFGMSVRSLRRRLVAEGIGFIDLVRQARVSLAKRMLENPHTSIREIAYAMGFATPETFHRAFKRWTRMTPKEYRSS